MNQQFTRSELAGIIACIDKEYGELYQMFQRQGIPFEGTPIYKHLCSIMKKAKIMADDITHGLIDYHGYWRETPEILPFRSGVYLVTISGFKESTLLFYDSDEGSWYDVDDDSGNHTYYNVTAWSFLPEAYHAE